MANIAISNRLTETELQFDLESISWSALADTVFELTQKQAWQDKEISLSFCDAREIQQLNRDYRGKDKVTDVLSFEAAAPGDPELPILGDIIICVKRAHEQAQELGHSNEREFAFLFVHGLLHLLGYDHQNDDDAKAMFALQDQVLEQHSISR